MRTRNVWPTGEARIKFECHATAPSTGIKCRLYALKGSKYCKRHGGKRGPVLLRQGKKMSGVYSKCLGPLMRDRVAELAAQPLAVQASAWEELQVQRALAQRALALASPALEGTITDPKIVAMSIGVANQALENVRNVLELVNKIEKDASDKYSIKTISLFVAQITRAIFRVVGNDNPELIRRIAKAIDEEVRVPFNNNVRGYDAGMEFASSGNAKLIEAMDTTTLPPDPTQVDAESDTVLSSASGETEWQDGVNEAEASDDASVDGGEQEAVG